jgi:hypothetical protein
LTALLNRYLASRFKKEMTYSEIKGEAMDKPKILLEFYGGLLNRVISTVDAEIYVISEDSKAKTSGEVEKWEPLIFVGNEEEFQHLVRKIISKEI